MLEKYKDQIILIEKELQDTSSKKMSKERISYLIEQTKEIAKDLDNEKDLRGLFYSRVNSIYEKGDTKYPKMRLNKVIKIMKEEVE